MSEQFDYDQQSGNNSEWTNRKELDSYNAWYDEIEKLLKNILDAVQSVEPGEK